MKKLASLILALAMCLALGAPAFATSETGDLTTELSAMLPELKMTLPSSATIVLNPYRSAVTDAVATAATGIDKNDRLQVMNGVFSVVSTTLSKVHVVATVTGSVGGNAEFASAAVAPGASGHKVYLTLTYGTDSAANTNTAPAVPAPDKVTNPTNVKVISDSELKLEWDLERATSSGTTAVQRLNMQFGGSCSDSPTEDEGPWTDSDTVSAAFVFTVTPVTDEPMITAVYQATDDTPTYGNFVINTTKPSDYKDSGKIDTIKQGAVTNGAYSLTAVTDATPSGSTAWGGSTWDGNKITLMCSANSNQLGAILGLTAGTKVLELKLDYKDKDGVDHSVKYTVKVNVLKAPESGA